ncbi:MAG: DUF4097 family beta strand repeat-containing protein, partial [Pyrinomonadaceae bacterium]
RANSISGPFVAGDVGGEARASSVSGDLRLGRVNGPLHVSSLSGSLTATLVRLEKDGIDIKSVSGSIEIRFSGEVNADFKADNISGRVHLDMPNVVVQGKLESPTVRARIGAGGALITISDVSGDIRLARA